MLLLIISLFVGALLFSMGFLLNVKNASSMLSGYNTMTTEERNQFKLVEYIGFFRKFHFSIGILIVVFSLVFYFLKLHDFIGFTLVFFSLPGYTYFIFKSQYYYPPQKRKILQVSFYIMLIVDIGVMILLFIPYQETKIEIFENKLIISGIYGEDLSLDQIEKVNLLNQLPPIKIKTNGFAMSSLKKGWFKLADGTKAKIIIDEITPPYLEITTQQNYLIIIGISNVDEELLYHQLKSIKN